MTKDELITVINTELERQCDLPQCNTPYVDSGPHTTIIDGEVDMDALANAIITGWQAS